MGLFEASDTPENLLIFQSKYREQISQLVAFGLDLPQADGSTKAVEVEVLVCGDKAFLSDENGHAGAAASFPSIYRLVTSEHLRKKHLDGSPHNRANPECHFQERTPESMEMDYHLNMTDTRSGTLRTRGKHHHSIVGPRLFPLPSQYNFAVSSLHIGLMVPLRLMGYMEADCDMIDGTKCDDDLAEIEAGFDELEGLAEDARDLETVGQVEESDGDETLTYVMRSNKVQREILEVQWQAKSIEVVEKEADMKEISERICVEISTLDRVVFLMKGDVSGVEKIARKMSKSRYSLKSFGKWEPRNRWQCNLCLLTGFDRDIQWKVCSNCQKSTHVFCQVSSEEELSNLNTFTCLSCQGVTNHEQIRERIANKIADLNRPALLINVELVALKKEESSLKQKCVKFMGATRLRLLNILEDDIKVNRSDYHSMFFVGNHCDKIVDQFAKITEVFHSEPEIKKKYDEFFEVYKPIHFLMKANRFLTPAELDQLDVYCEQIGEIYPRKVKKSIPPKLGKIFSFPPQCL